MTWRMTGCLHHLQAAQGGQGLTFGNDLMYLEGSSFYERPQQAKKDASKREAGWFDFPRGLTLRNSICFDLAGIGARSRRFLQGSQTTDVVQVRMRDHNAFHILRGFAQARYISQDLLRGARQPCIDERQPIHIHKDIRVRDDARDDKY